MRVFTIPYSKELIHRDQRCSHEIQDGVVPDARLLPMAARRFGHFVAIALRLIEPITTLVRRLFRVNYELVAK